MRIASVVVLLGVLSACDSVVIKADQVSASGPQVPVKTQLFVPPSAPEVVADPSRVTFSATGTLGEASCFATVDTAGGTLVLVTDDDGGVELVNTVGDSSSRETIVAASAANARRVSACALSLDAKGQPEVVVAFLAGDASETVHYRRDAGGWRAARVASFAAVQVAFNAKSPRGSEVIAVDAWMSSVHAILVDGGWQTRALPASAFAAAGALAVAVAVDADGRSHFALGANYYGDRDGQYVYWPGRTGAGAGAGVGVGVGEGVGVGAGAGAWSAAGGLAIVFDPADPARAPQIIHAERERAPGSADVFATHLFRTVIGPDSASTSVWAKATAIMGYSQHFAPYAGQLAARIDEDGHLHTLATVLDERTLGTTWSVDYVHDRDGAPHHTVLRDVRATGQVALAGDDRLIASDHGDLVELTRTSSFPEVEPAPILAPPPVGTVDTCDAGFADGVTVLRHMTGLSAVVLATGDDAGVHALEWDYDRRAVRQTSGDAIGWDTRQVSPWQLDIMSAGRSQAAVVDGHDHLVWPEGDGLAHWTDASGRWVRSSPEMSDVRGTPDLTAGARGELWLSAVHAPHGVDELVVARFAAGSWSAPLVVPVEGSPEAQALVAGESGVAGLDGAVVFAERAVGSDVARLVMATHDGAGWVRRDLGLSARRVIGVRAASDAHGAIAVVVSVEDAAGYATVALRVGEGTTELGRWAAPDATGSRALDAVASADGGVVLVWDGGNDLEAAFIDGAVVTRRTLTAPAGATLWTGGATREGRLVAVVQRQTGPAQTAIDLIGEACAR